MANDPTLFTPFILNLTLAVANTEGSIQLPAYTKNLTIKTRNASHTARMAVKTGLADATTGTYMTINEGGVPFENGVKTDCTLYFESPDAGAVIEILGWSQRA